MNLNSLFISYFIRKNDNKHLNSIRSSHGTRDGVPVVMAGEASMWLQGGFLRKPGEHNDQVRPNSHSWLIPRTPWQENTKGIPHDAPGSLFGAFAKGCTTPFPGHLIGLHTVQFPLCSAEVEGTDELGRLPGGWSLANWHISTRRVPSPSPYMNSGATRIALRKGSCGGVQVVPPVVQSVNTCRLNYVFYLLYLD